MNPRHAALDHLVVAAPTLAQGVAWCEQALGLTPGPGGRHALYGTHNRLLRLDSHTPQDPPAYLEIIAIDPEATPTRAAPARRWFDLDDPGLRQRLADQGPQLVHWVARVPDLDAALRAWKALGLERGPALGASRPTPEGLLQWRISVREDGQRLMDGCLPTLIEWGDTHPARQMPHSGLRLRGLHLRHPEGKRLRAALSLLGLQGVVTDTGPARLAADLHGPAGACPLVSLPD